MIIRSKDKDYYDIGQKDGVDTTINFIRSPKLICDDSIYLKAHDLFVIGFCGEIYPFYDLNRVIISLTYFNKFLNISEREKRFSKEKLANIKENIFFMEEEIEYQIDQFNLHKSRYIQIGKKWVLDNFKDLKITKSFDYLFLKYNTPIFLIWHKHRSEKYNLLINPILEELGFQKIYDSFSAFQKISQFLTNELVIRDNPNVIMTNENIAISKGFDRYSFRNNTTKNKPKKF